MSGSPNRDDGIGLVEIFCLQSCAQDDYVRYRLHSTTDQRHSTHCKSSFDTSFYLLGRAARTLRKTSSDPELYLEERAIHGCLFDGAFIICSDADHGAFRESIVSLTVSAIALASRVWSNFITVL